MRARLTSAPFAFAQQETFMTEITRVPLQPIAKGSLGKLWLGVLAVLLAAGGIAWASLPAGVVVKTIKAGSGEFAGNDDVVFAKYTGKLTNGQVFDTSRESQVPIKGLFPDGSPLPVAGLVPGMTEGLKQTQKGGKYVIEIPAAKAYGANPPQGAPIPANADLVFAGAGAARRRRATEAQRCQSIAIPWRRSPRWPESR
jgi:FKBP-type peptidyl-prolyl cis-trans isomerase FkpA